MPDGAKANWRVWSLFCVPDKPSVDLIPGGWDRCRLRTQHWEPPVSAILSVRRAIEIFSSAPSWCSDCRNTRPQIRGIRSDLRHAKRNDVRSRGHDDVLLSIHHVSHGRCPQGLVHVKVPKCFTGPRVNRRQRAVVVAKKHHASRGREDTSRAMARSDLRNFPRDLSSLHIDCPQEFLMGLAGDTPRCAAIE